MRGRASMVGRVSAKSEIAAAIGYTLSRWQALTRYCDDGRIEIDNNGAERAFRVVSLGRNEAKAVFMRSPPFGVDAGGRGQVVEALDQVAEAPCRQAGARAHANGHAKHGPI